MSMSDKCINNSRDAAKTLFGSKRLEAECGDGDSNEAIKCRRAEELYRLLFNGGNDAIYVYRMKDGQPREMVEVNGAGLRSLGYAREELLGMLMEGFVANDIIGTNAWKVFWHRINTCGHAMIESIHVTKAGKQIPVEVNAHLLEYAGDTLVIAIARDITARIKAQYELKRQLDFEKLIGLISARFINGDIKKADEYITISLQEVSEFLKVDRSFIYCIASLLSNRSSSSFRLMALANISPII